MFRVSPIMASGLAALLLWGCGGTSLGPARKSTDVKTGGQYLQPWLDAALKQATRYPLGSPQNPVRADMPAGERAYLDRLRCKNGTPPTYERVGETRAGVFGSFVDHFDVRCQNSAPLRTLVVMDMYFPGHVETQPVDGFTLTAR